MLWKRRRKQESRESVGHHLAWPCSPQCQCLVDDYVKFVDSLSRMDRVDDLSPREQRDQAISLIPEDVIVALIVLLEFVRQDRGFQRGWSPPAAYECVGVFEHWWAVEQWLFEGVQSRR